jgi:peptidase E
MDEVAKYLGVLLVGMAIIGAGAGAVAAGEAGEQTSFNIDKNTLAPGLQLMPANSNFEINSLTIGEFKFSEEFDIDNSQINLLEIKYKFN